MAAPPGVHVVALWLYIASDGDANDLFHSVSDWRIYRRANSLKRILVLATVVELWRLILGVRFKVQAVREHKQRSVDLWTDIFRINGLFYMMWTLFQVYCFYSFTSCCFSLLLFLFSPWVSNFSVVLLLLHVEFIISGLVLLTRLPLILPRCLFGLIWLRLSKLNSSSKGATWLIIKLRLGLWGRTELAALVSSAGVATLLHANPSAKMIVLVFVKLVVLVH